MANNTIQVTYKVNEDGSLEKIATKANKAAAATEKAGKASDNFNKQQKGVAGATSNSTKAFSKMTNGINSGLVPAYATLAANVFAVSAAFGVLQRAAAVKQLEAGLMAVGRAGGANLKIVANGLREITDMAVSTQAAMEATAIATSAGFSENQIKSLGEVAKGASLALGRDMTDALNRLVRGTSKLEPELLDELGIFVKIDGATTRYAAALGKSADELTQFERRQAFVNEAISEGQKKFGILNLLVEANPYDKLAASFADLAKTGLNFANTVLGPIVGFLAEAPMALVGLFGAFASGIVSQIIPSLESSALAAKASAQASAREASRASMVVSEEYKKAAAGVQSAWKTVPKSVAQLEEKFKKGTYSAKELKLAIQRLSQSETLRKNAKVSGDKEMAALRARELREVQALKTEMLALQAAESKRFTASSKGLRAKGSARMDTITSAGLSQMDRANGVMEKFSIATRAAGLHMRTLGKTSGVTNKIVVGFRAAAGAARLFGSALLSAIPVIGQVIMIGSLLYEGYKWLFDKKPTLLDKELEKAQERYAEFPNIISQMAIAYNAAATRTQAFAAAMKPTVGLLKQTSDQITAIINAEKNAKIAEYAKAQGALVANQAKVNELKRKEEEMRASGRIYSIENSETGNMDSFAKDSEAQAVINDLISLQGKAGGAMRRLQEEAKKLKDTAFSSDAVAGITEAMVKFQSTQLMSLDIANKGSSEYALLQSNIAAVDKIMANLAAGGSVEAAKEEFDKLTATATSLEGAFDGAAESVRKVEAEFTAARQVTGAFATDIKLMSEITNALTNKSTPEVILQYASAMKEYGIAIDEALLKKGKDDLFSDEEIAALERAKEQFKELQERFQQYNTESKWQATIAAGIEESARQQSIAGQKALALETQMTIAKEETRLANENLQLSIIKGVGVEEAVLRVLKAQSAELLKQEQIRQQKVADVTRTQGADMGAVEDATSMVARDASKITGMNPESIQTMNQAMQPMIDNLAKLGPEGELMATLTQSAFTMTEVFTGAFEKMSEGSFSLVDGIGVAASAIQALGSIQAAQGKAAVANIDKQIEAEKKRDGKSKESVAKIAQLEKKKEQMERKNFERDKKMKMASVVSSTAVGIMKAYEQGGMLGFVTGAIIAGIGAMQLSAIAGTSYDGGGSGTPTNPSKISIGNRQNSVDMARARSPSGELAYARGASGTGTGMTNFTPAFTGMKYRASGGNTGLMVGEQGPELFIPDRPGRVVPADDVARGGAPVNVNFTIQAIDTQNMEQALMAQRGAMIGMIREAANAHGENFLESINTEALSREK